MIALSESPGHIGSPVRSMRVGGSAGGPCSVATSARAPWHASLGGACATRRGAMGGTPHTHSHNRTATPYRPAWGLSLGGSLHG